MVRFKSLSFLFAFTLVNLFNIALSSDLEKTNGENSFNYRSTDLRNSTNDLEFVMLGATGDLATRYLWPAVFRLFMYKDCDSSKFRVYAATRQPEDVIERYVDTILKRKVLQCEFYPTESECETCRLAFFEAVVPRQLANEEHYQLLGKEISERVKLKSLPASIMVYLAVPPFAYHKITKNVNKYFRIPGTDLRIVLEKPFGHDYASCEDLLAKVGENIDELETYRIDHYLGKQTVDALLRFRQRNKDILEKLTNQYGIGLVETVMKETLDCKSRTKFYDRYGVILDVMQNHLTEVLARVIMEIPNDLGNNSEFILNKQKAISQVWIPSDNNVVLGQYRHYNTHRDEELNDGQGKSHETWMLSRTPTFAAILLYSGSKQWENVPFILLSGKQLNEKSTYVRLWFKNKGEVLHLVNTFEDEHEVSEHNSIIFYIHSVVFGGPAIVIQGDISAHQFSFDDDWQEIDYSCYRCKVFKPKSIVDPYSMLIRAVALGQKSKFIGKEELLYSWKLWTPLIHKIRETNPILYDKLQTETLNFKVIPETQNLAHLTEGMGSGFDNFSFCKDKNLDQPYGVYNSYSVSYLAHKIAVKIACLSKLYLSRKKQFHVALPGGKSVSHVVKALIQKKEFIVWDIFHVWFIDERCVQSNSSYSNYKLLKESFFDKVPLKAENIHTVLRNENSINCEEAAKDYDQEIRTTVPGLSFDLIVLGLGVDSHIASIFPDDNDTIDTHFLVRKTDKGPEHSIKSRITVTPAVLKLSKRLIVLVFGKEKENMYQNICHRLQSVKHLKFLADGASSQLIGWYVDMRIGSCKGKRLKDEL